MHFLENDNCRLFQDGMCALYIALEAGHKDVAALIYGKNSTTGLSRSASADVENLKVRPFLTLLNDKKDKI